MVSTIDHLLVGREYDRQALCGERQGYRRQGTVERVKYRLAEIEQEKHAHETGVDSVNEAHVVQAVDEKEAGGDGEKICARCSGV